MNSKSPPPVSEGTTSARRILRTIPLAAALVLAACGGGGSSNPAPQKTVCVAAYGDSTQEGQGDPHAATRPGFVIENHAVSGTNTEQLLAIWPEALRATKATIVAIKHGVNDYRLPGGVELFRANLRALVEAAQAAGKRVVLEVPHPVGEPPTQLMKDLGFDVPAYEARRQAIRDLGAHMGVFVCEHGRVSLFDGIHQDAAGVVAEGETLAACLREVVA